MPHTNTLSTVSFVTLDQYDIDERLFDRSYVTYRFRAPEVITYKDRFCCAKLSHLEYITNNNDDIRETFFVLSEALGTDSLISRTLSSEVVHNQLFPAIAFGTRSPKNGRMKLHDSTIIPAYQFIAKMCQGVDIMITTDPTDPAEDNSKTINRAATATVQSSRLRLIFTLYQCFNSSCTLCSSISAARI